MSGSLTPPNVAAPQKAAPTKQAPAKQAPAAAPATANSDAQQQVGQLNTPMGQVELQLRLGIPDRLKLLEALDGLSSAEKQAIRTNQGYMDQIEARLPGDMYVGACEKLGYTTTGDDFAAFDGMKGSTEDPADVAEMDRLHEKARETAKASWAAWAGQASVWVQAQLKLALPKALELGVEGVPFPLLMPPPAPSFSLSSARFGTRFLESRLGEDPLLTFSLDHIEQGTIMGNVDIDLDGPLPYEWFDEEMQWGVVGEAPMPDPVTVSYDPRMFKLWRLDTLKFPRTMGASRLASRWTIG